MQWQPLCNINDLIENAGVCAKFQGQQIALFCLNQGQDKDNRLFALANWDPIGGANVLSRGIIGSVSGEPVVASPLYKQHFSLESGQCLEDEAVKVPVYQVRQNCDLVEIAAQPQ